MLFTKPHTMLVLQCIISSLMGEQTATPHRTPGGRMSVEVLAKVQLTSHPFWAGRATPPQQLTPPHKGPMLASVLGHRKHATFQTQ